MISSREQLKFNYLLEKNEFETRRPASTGIFFAQDFNQLLQTGKKENAVLSPVFKGFPQTSIPQLISQFLALSIYQASEVKVQNPRYFSESPIENLKLFCEILKVEIQPVLLEETSLIMGKSHYKTHFCQFQAKRLRRQGTYLGIFLSSHLIHN